MSASSHHPFDAHEEDFHEDILERFNRVESDLDEITDEADDEVTRDRNELASLFAAWLGSELASAGFNPQISLPDSRDEYEWFDRHIARTYRSGREAARELLDAAGHNVPNTPGIANSATHQRSLETVLSRQREAWDNLTGDLEREARESASEALSGNGTIRDGRDAVADRIEKVGKHRGRLIAQTETSRAYNYALLSEYEDAGVYEVTIQEVDWTTAGDSRVCEGCAGMAGTYTIDEARSMLEDGTFPHHPACRCLLLPA